MTLLSSQVGALFCTSRRGLCKLLCLPSLHGVLIVKFDTAEVLVNFFPLIYEVKSHFRLLMGRSQITVAGGDVPPHGFSFDHAGSSRNIYCSQDPLARAGECSVEALHCGS